MERMPGGGVVRHSGAVASPSGLGEGGVLVVAPYRNRRLTAAADAAAVTTLGGGGVKGDRGATEVGVRWLDLWVCVRRGDSPYTRWNKDASGVGWLCHSACSRWSLRIRRWRAAMRRATKPFHTRCSAMAPVVRRPAPRFRSFDTDLRRRVDDAAACLDGDTGVVAPPVPALDLEEPRAFLPRFLLLVCPRVLDLAPARRLTFLLPWGLWDVALDAAEARRFLAFAFVFAFALVRDPGLLEAGASEAVCMEPGFALGSFGCGTSILSDQLTPWQPRCAAPHTTRRPRQHHQATCHATDRAEYNPAVSI